jgi:signal transduction histidine kinase
VPRELLPLVRAANDALVRLERGFVADAAHEPCTPLAIICAQIEAFAGQCDAQAPLGGIDNMTRIVNQLIDVAEPDTLTIRPGEVADLRANAA